MSDGRIAHPLEFIAGLVRNCPDYPKPGILFKDITPVLENAEGFKVLIEALKDRAFHFRFDKVLAIESRGFLMGAPLAYATDRGIAIVRKKGKLPWKTVHHVYSLEYGEDELHIHDDAIRPGERVLIVDDVLATGGTAGAAATLVQKLGGEVSGLLVFMEIELLKGADALLRQHRVRTESLLKV